MPRKSRFLARARSISAAGIEILRTRRGPSVFKALVTFGVLVVLLPLLGCGVKPSDCNGTLSLNGCPSQSSPTIQLSPPTPGAGSVVSTLACQYGGKNTCLGASQYVSIQVPPDEDVDAVQDGSVISQNADCLQLDLGTGGNLTGNWRASYCGMNSFNVTVGQHVQRGQLIGSCCTLNVIKLSVSYNGKVLDPLKYFVGSSYGNSFVACSGTCPAMSPAVSGSATAGLESYPTWLWQGTNARMASVAKSRWSLRNRFRGVPLSLSPAELANDLASLFPPSVNGASKTMATPTDVLGASNAVQTSGAEYWQGNARIGAATVFETTGAPYIHDYAVCSRFKGGYVQGITRMDVSSYTSSPQPAYLWGAGVYKPDDPAGPVLEYEASFVAYIAADHITLMSRWIEDDYPVQNGTEILNFQVWGNSIPVTGQLIQGILAQLKTYGPLTIDTTAQQNADFAIVTAMYDGSTIRLDISNMTTAPLNATATIVGWSNMLNHSMTTTTQQVLIPSGENAISLRAQGLLNAVVYLGDSIFTDKAYVSDGEWETWTGGIPSPMVTMSAIDCPAPVRRGRVIGIGRPLPGCINLSGTVPAGAWAGLARVISTPTRPVLNLAGGRLDTLKFMTIGDGQTYEVHLDTIRTQSTGNPYVFSFTAPTQLTTLTIPLIQFRTQNGIPFDVSAATDLTTVTWVASALPTSSVNLTVQNAVLLPSVPIRLRSR